MGEILGKGQSGSVYKAMHLSTGIEIALKVIEKSSYRQNKEQTDLIERELEYLTELDHPNLVCAVDLFEDNKNIYIGLELIDGGDL